MPEANNAPVIFDHSVLGNFALMGEIGLLKSLYLGRAFMCKSVLRQIQADADRGSMYPQRIRFQTVLQAIDDEWLKLSYDFPYTFDEVIELRLALEYGQRFGMGSAESISIAKCRNWAFACDEKSTRKFALEQNVRITSTLGILIKAVKLGIIDKNLANRLHQQLINIGYQSPYTQLL